MTPAEILALLVTLLSFAVAVGAERQKRIELGARLAKQGDDLERRHGELAKEAREAIAECRRDLRSVELASARTDTTVAGLHDSMARVESAIMRMADRLDQVLGDRSGPHERR